jgi:hypothetical protein
MGFSGCGTFAASCAPVPIGINLNFCTKLEEVRGVSNANEPTLQD